MTNNAKLFAYDTSLFSAVHYVSISAKELNNDLEKVYNWAFQWNVTLNPDPSKQSQEVAFSRKLKRSNHHALVFNNNNVSQTYSQKHLGVILDFKLTFEQPRENLIIFRILKAIFLSSYDHIQTLFIIVITLEGLSYYKI